MPRDGGPLALVIDLGSSSLRAGLWRPDGRPVRGTGYAVEARLQTERPGEATIDPRSLLARVDDALDRLTADHARLLDRVEVGAVSCFLHSFVAVDRQWQPLGAIETWADTRAARAARALQGEVDADAVRERTGCPVAASYWPARVRHRGGRAEGHWAGAAELVLHHLTGARAVPRNVASGTGLLDRRTGDWDRELLDALRLPVDALPDLVGDGTEVGRLSRRGAERWPRLARVRWQAPWGDASTSNVGLGAVMPDRAALNVGTSAALRAIVERQPQALPAGLFAFRLFDRAIVGGQLSEGGGVLDWVAGLVRRSRRRLDAEAAVVPPGSDGVAVLPWLAGQRGLEYRDDASGVVAGLSLASDAATVYRAAAEAVAFGLAAVDEQLTAALGAPPRLVGGGGALSGGTFLAQLIADVIGRPVEVTRPFEATSRGAALLALQGGIALDRSDLAPTFHRVFAPDLAATRAYAVGRAHQRRLASRLFD
jgi:gluconokinase